MANFHHYAVPALILAFILQIYEKDTHKPINHLPWHIYPTYEECNTDHNAMMTLAPEWYSICIPEPKGEVRK